MNRELRFRKTLEYVGCRALDTQTERGHTCCWFTSSAQEHLGNCLAFLGVALIFEVIFLCLQICHMRWPGVCLGLDLQVNADSIRVPYNITLMRGCVAWTDGH